ncbi:L,D-transpeptidase family protein [Mumia sp. zg.B53]|uniref:L,D-transpeptidase n=1 Tax=Mumia sp. zg.B53 TaxID=2855449 RepID=UPI001C6E6B13|nr:L,D-transpeptidase [Mumia sp. zg.B53]MBW9215544.1 L,D-transpeptidase family protein [Mumia sp. zg.B53]
MTVRRDRSVTSSGRHSARRRPRRHWPRWTAAILAGGMAATVFALHEDLVPEIGIDALVKPAGAAPVGGFDAAGPAVYPPAAPSVGDAQVAPPAAPVQGPVQGPTVPPSVSPSSQTTPTPGATATSARASQAPLPARSGKGRRIVFSMSEQRVWLVRKDGRTARTYEVSGSKLDNLGPGRYEVYSRSRHATSYDLGSTMEYFVRFTRGVNAPIGFHTIPVDGDGRPVQTRKQLGTPLSSGCVRQHRPDAIALWEFAPVGTVVVVVA